MTFRRFSSFAAVVVSVAVGLQPRFASAVADMDDLAAWLSQINGQLDALNDEFSDYADMFYGEQYQSAWFRGTMQRREAFQDSVETTLRRALYEEFWTPRAAGRTNGMVRGLWNVDRGVSGLAGVFTNRESYYLDPDLMKQGFVFWDYKYGNVDYITPSYLEFLSLTQGQEFDPGIFWDSVDSETSFQNAFGGINGPSHDPMGAGDGTRFAFWVPWQAEAWRRQLQMQSNLLYSVGANVTNSAAWNDTNTRDDANVWNDVLISSTNEVGQGVQPEEPFTIPTNVPTWFGPANSDAAVDVLLPEINWELDGEANEVRLFGFDELDGSLTGILSIDFTSEPWPTVRSVLQFAIAVTTCCVLVSIVRSEVNYWTTLGGSAT